MLKKDLEYLGLAEKEALIYMAALELGKAPVQKIAQKAGVNRATAYVIIEALSKKGLISNYTEGKKQFFCAEAPEKLSLLFREEVMEIQRRQEYLDKILPELKSLNASVKSRPVVRYYEGKAGIRAIAEELFISEYKDDVRMIFSNDLLTQTFSEEELVSMTNRRKAKGTKAKAIVNDEFNKLKTRSDAELFRLPTKNYSITSDIAFFGDKIRIVTQKGESAGLIIENKEVANTLKILFDLAWKYLENKKRGLEK